VALHIDLVRSELASGTRSPIARISVVHGDLHVDSDHPEVHREMLLGILGEGALLTNSRRVLTRLHDRLQGSYVFATEPHEGGTCPYDEAFDGPADRPLPAANGRSRRRAK